MALGGALVRELPSGTVTFLFTDIEGSTRLLQLLGETEYGALQETHRAVVRAALADHDGVEIATEGDSFFVAFASASSAVAAAVDAQVALGAHPWGDHVIRVRMGVHTGQATPRNGDYTALVVHQAARISAAAHGGQILMSASTKDAMSGAPDRWRLEPLGRHRLKDLAAPVEIYQVAADGLGEQFPPARSLEVVAHNLPIQVSSFVGRAVERLEVAKSLARARLVSVVGPGGAGKTRLAYQVAADAFEDHPGGIWVAELAPVTDPDAAASVLLTALGLRDEPGRTPTETVVDHLRGRAALIVVDNCEHVLDGASSLVQSLLSGCRDVRVLVTSREGLRLPGEVVYHLGGLAVPSDVLPEDAVDMKGFDAVRLFISRASDVGADVALEPGNTAVIGALCRRLDGLPLAIELAASRALTLSPTQINERLNHALDLLSKGARHADARHATLRGAIEWSHRLLPEPDRVLFRRLSVFAGGWTLEAAEDVCSGGDLERGLVLDTLDALVDKCLVSVGQDEQGELRYRLLETIQAYAEEQLIAAGEEATTRARHLTWGAALAEQESARQHGPEQGAALDRLAAEHDNLRAALRHALAAGDLMDGVRVAGRVWLFWMARGHLSEGRAWLEALAARTEDLVVTDRIGLLDGAGNLARAQGDLAGARGWFEQSLELARRLGNKRGECLTLVNVGNVAFAQGHLDQATELFEASLVVSREIDDVHGLSLASSGLGTIAAVRGDFESARPHFQEVLALMRRTGDVRNTAMALCNLANVILDAQGDLDAAHGHYDEARRLFDELGNTVGVTHALRGLGQIAIAQERFEDARRLCEESLELSRSVGDREGIAQVLLVLIDPYLAAGEVARARTAVDEALAFVAEVGHVALSGSALRRSAQVAEREGDLPRAGDCYREALRLPGALAERPALLLVLEGLARVDRDPVKGAQLLAAASAARHDLGPRAWPHESLALAETSRRLAELLGESRFTAATAAGRELDIAAAVELALAAGPTD